MPATGTKAWSVFGEIGLAGLPASMGKLKAFDAAGKKAGISVLGLQGAALGAAAGIAVLAGAAAIFTVSSVKAFGDFDEAMTSSLAIMGNVSDAMKSEMSVAARQVAKTTSFSAKQAADSYFFLASAGLDAVQSVAAMPQVAAFAQAGNFDLARATDLLTDAQSALGLTTKDATKNLANMARVSDVLVKANTLANASVEQFSESLTNKAGARLRILNKDIEEGVAVLAAYADQGVKGSLAGERLNIVLRDLPDQAVKSAAAFERLGVAVFDTNDNVRHTADILEDFERVMAGASDQTKVQTFQQLGLNKRVADGLVAIIGLSGKIREYEAALKSAGGITEEVASKQMDTLNKKVGILGDTFKDLKISLGEMVAPDVIEFIEDLTSAIEQLHRWSTLAARAGIKFSDVAPGPNQSAWILKLIGHTAELEHEYRQVGDAFEEMGLDMEAGLKSLARGGESVSQTLRRLQVESTDFDDFLDNFRDIGSDLSPGLRKLSKSGETLSQTFNRVRAETGDLDTFFTTLKDAGAPDMAAALRKLADEGEGLHQTFDRLLSQSDDFDSFVATVTKAARAASVMRPIEIPPLGTPTPPEVLERIKGKESDKTRIEREQAEALALEAVEFARQRALVEEQLGIRSTEQKIARLRTELDAEEVGSDERLTIYTALTNAELQLDLKREDSAKALAEKRRAIAQQEFEESVRFGEQWLQLQVENGNLSLENYREIVQFRLQFARIMQAGTIEEIRLERQLAQVNSTLTDQRIMKAQELALVNKMAAVEFLTDWMVALEAVGELTPEVVQKMRAAMQSMGRAGTDAASTFEQGFYAVGRQLGMGLVSGVISVKSILITAFSLLLNRGLSSMASSMFKSPPLARFAVTYDWGAELAKGLALGVRSQVPTVEAAFGELMTDYDIAVQPVVDIEPLGALEFELDRTLEVDVQPVVDIEPLAELEPDRSLEVGIRPVIDTGAFGALEPDQTLDITVQPVVDVGAFGALEPDQMLEVDIRPVVDIEPLAELELDQTLEVAVQPVVDAGAFGAVLDQLARASEAMKGTLGPLFGAPKRLPGLDLMTQPAITQIMEDLYAARAEAGVPGGRKSFFRDVIPLIESRQEEARQAPVVKFDFTGMPSAKSPMESTRDAVWQEFLRESLLEAESGGFRAIRKRAE